MSTSLRAEVLANAVAARAASEALLTKFLVSVIFVVFLLFGASAPLADLLLLLLLLLTNAEKLTGCFITLLILTVAIIYLRMGGVVFGLQRVSVIASICCRVYHTVVSGDGGL